MNKNIENLMYESGLTAQGCWDEFDQYDKEAIERFAKLIVRECTKTVQNYVDHRIPASEYASRLQQDMLDLEPEEPRELLCYVERQEGYYPVYKPKKGSIVTQAFILCSWCNKAISTTGGPKHDAVCLECYRS